MNKYIAGTVALGLVALGAFWLTGQNSSGKGMNIFDKVFLESPAAKIGGLRGRLRAVHLGYHLRMVDLLTPEQIAAYDRLRGYGQADEHGHGGPDHHHRH